MPTEAKMMWLQRRPNHRATTVEEDSGGEQKAPEDYFCYTICLRSNYNL
jgi:hypothetical protein